MASITWARYAIRFTFKTLGHVVECVVRKLQVFLVYGSQNVHARVSHLVFLSKIK